MRLPVRGDEIYVPDTVGLERAGELNPLLMLRWLGKRARDGGLPVSQPLELPAEPDASNEERVSCEPASVEGIPAPRNVVTDERSLCWAAEAARWSILRWKRWLVKPFCGPCTERWAMPEFPDSR